MEPDLKLFQDTTKKSQLKEESRASCLGMSSVYVCVCLKRRKKTKIDSQWEFAV